MVISVRKAQPTWKSEFAQYAYQSRYPNLYRGLIRAYSMGLGSTGTVIQDLSGKKSNGSLNNMAPATDWVLNDGRYCLDVDGATSSEHLLFSFPAFGTVGRYTFSFWFKQDQTAGFHCIFDDTNRNYSLFLNESGEISFSSGVTNGLGVATNGMTDGEWHNLLVTRSDGRVKSYVDGVLKEDKVNAEDISAADVHFGDNPSGGGTVFLGQYDDIFLYDRHFSGNEARLLSNIGRGGIFQFNPVVTTRTAPIIVAGILRHPGLTGNMQDMRAGMRG